MTHKRARAAAVVAGAVALVTAIPATSVAAGPDPATSSHKASDVARDR